jgi:hypothetical protein
MPIKKCSKCSAEKPLDEFHKNKATPDGLQSYCKVCVNSQIRSRRKASKSSQQPPKASTRCTTSKAKHNTLKSNPRALQHDASLPPIKEIEHRAQKRVSFSFLGPDSSTSFVYDSFAEARQAREQMRPAFAQLEIYDRVKRVPGRPTGSGD